MPFVQFRMIAKGAVIRAALLGILGVVVILFPDFLTGGIIYAIAAYAILNGTLGIVDFAVSRDGKEMRLSYLNVIVAGLAIVCGILCVVYFRYIASAQPVFFGVLLVIEGVVHFVAALCVKSKLKVLSIIFSLLLAFGDCALVVFTFGFGGLPTLSKMFGGLLLFSSVSELLIYLMYKLTNKSDGGRT